MFGGATRPSLGPGSLTIGTLQCRLKDCTVVAPPILYIFFQNQLVRSRLTRLHSLSTSTHRFSSSFCDAQSLKH